MHAPSFHRLLLQCFPACIPIFILFTRLFALPTHSVPKARHIHVTVSFMLHRTPSLTPTAGCLCAPNCEKLWVTMVWWNFVSAIFADDVHFVCVCVLTFIALPAPLFNAAPIQKTIFFFCSCWAHKTSPNEYYRMHSESHRYQWLYSSCMLHALLFKCECYASHNNVLIPSQLLLCRRVRQCHFVLFTTEFISFH